MIGAIGAASASNITVRLWSFGFVGAMRHEFLSTFALPIGTAALALAIRGPLKGTAQHASFPQQPRSCESIPYSDHVGGCHPILNAMLEPVPLFQVKCVTGRGCGSPSMKMSTRSFRNATRPAIGVIPPVVNVYIHATSGTLASCTVADQ
jgi:hypothetical protein